MSRKKKIWIEVKAIPKNIEHKDKLIIPHHKFIRINRSEEEKTWDYMGGHLPPAMVSVKNDTKKV